MIFSFDRGPRLVDKRRLRKRGHRHGDRSHGAGERGLLIDQGREGAPKSRHQDARDRLENQVDRPGIFASADEIEVPRATLVHIHPEVHEHSWCRIRLRAGQRPAKQCAVMRDVPIGDATTSCCLSLAWDIRGRFTTLQLPLSDMRGRARLRSGAVASAKPQRKSIWKTGTI